MPRTEKELMDGWEFAAEQGGERIFAPVSLPHDWVIDREYDRYAEEGDRQGFRNHFGTGYYRRNVELHVKEEGYRYLLSFGGICENSTIWVNGLEAGGRKYGYSPFSVDVTELLREGGNLVEIRVDNTQHPGDRWYNGAGIYRTVKLVQVEEAHFDPLEVKVQTKIEGDTAEITVSAGPEEWLRDENPTTGDSGRRTVLAELYDPDGIPVAASEGCGKVLTLPVEKVRLWSAETPNLYRLTLTLLDGGKERDRISFRIGLRTVELVPDKGMIVNGETVKLKGVCLHQDVGCLGIAARKEIYRQRLLALKEMGCNAIRPAHHVYSEEFLDLCDELGFYVYEECFDKWYGGLYGRYFETEWQKDVDAMVKRDRNRPCIVMWGVGNEVENQGQGSMLAALKLLTEYVRTLDTRPVSYAMNPHFKRESHVDVRKVEDIQQFVDEVSNTEIYDNAERVERIAGIARYVDVISCNYQEQWYPLIHERMPDKLILGTEVYQYFSGAPDQMQNFTDTIPVLAVKNLDYCIGSFLWTGIDYLGESMGWPAKGWGGSMIRTNGSRRFGYYLMQSCWSDRPMVHFSVMDYSLEDEGVKEHWDTPMFAHHWHFPQFRKAVIPYAIVSNCEEVRLYLNGKRIYIPQPESCKNGMISGFLPYRPGIVEAAGFNGGKEACRDILRTPGEAAGLQFLGDAWTFRMGGNGDAADRDTLYLPAKKGYQIQLSVRVVDKEGTPCFREYAKVRFHAEGPARILAVDAGEITGSEPYRSDTIHIFRGQASVVAVLTGDPGRVRIHAAAEGLLGAAMTILVQQGDPGKSKT